VITNCAIVDVRAGNVRERQTIVVDAEQISAITPADRPIDGPSQVIDGSGCYATPGLIDMHAHACCASDEPAETPAAHEPTLMGIRAVRNLQLAARSGITTVRDLGGGHGAPFAVKAAWLRGEFIGARPLVAGPMVTAVGGHGAEDGSTLGVEVTGVDEMRRTVRRLVSHGADVIKVVTGGAVARTELTLDELRAAVDEAHWCGVPVASHANLSLRGIRNSIAAGCDSVEHCCVPDRAALEAMAATGIAMCPTITVLAHVRSDPDAYGGPTGALPMGVNQAWETHQRNVRLARELGVRIIAGSDAGMPGVPFDSLLDELAWLVRCGSSPAQALAAATVDAAAVLGRNDLGEIRVGGTADLVLLNRDPIADIGALVDRRAVVIAGRLVWSSTPEAGAYVQPAPADPDRARD
jgi:imidazolonepropionase-like amidohydrolase